MKVIWDIEEELSVTASSCKRWWRHQTNWNSAKRITVPYTPRTPKHWDKLKQINSRKKSLLLNDVMTAKLAAETQQTFSLLQIRREGSNGQNVFTCVLQSVRSDMARWSDSFFPIIYQRKGEPFTGHIKWSWLMPSRCKRWWRHQTNWNSAKRNSPIHAKHPEALRLRLPARSEGILQSDCTAARKTGESCIKHRHFNERK